MKSRLRSAKALASGELKGAEKEEALANPVVAAEAARISREKKRQQSGSTRTRRKENR